MDAAISMTAARHQAFLAVDPKHSPRSGLVNDGRLKDFASAAAAGQSSQLQSGYLFCRRPFARLRVEGSSLLGD